MPKFDMQFGIVHAAQRCARRLIEKPQLPVCLGSEHCSSAIEVSASKETGTATGSGWPKLERRKDKPLLALDRHLPRSIKAGNDDSKKSDFAGGTNQPPEYAIYGRTPARPSGC
jgi:hypothetical protein